MARDRNIARNSARINPEGEDRLSAGDAHSVAHLARLPAPDGPGPNALPTTLSAGQIAFTAFQSDNTGGAGGDYFQFVLLTAVNAGTTIYFTDNGSRTDNFRFRTNEQVLRWVAQSDLPAGTLISFTATGGAGVPNTAEWTGITPGTGSVATNAQLALSAGGDNITAFVSPVFGGSDNLGGTAIAALAFGQATFSTTYNTSGPTSQTGLPGGLTDGVNAVSIAPTDNGRYTGTTSGTASALRSGMNTDTNWTTDMNPLSPHGVAAITVLNPGMLSVNDVTLAEGNSGTTSFVFTITRTGGSDGAVGATWTLTTFFGGNVDAADFVTYPQSGTVSFANGETSRQITIQVQGDTIVEPDEAFTVTLSAPTGGVTTSNIGVGRILNDDVASISIDDISHSEGDNGSTVYTFTVTRSGGSAGAVGATWTIGFPGGAGGANSGDLAAGQSLTGTVSFADGETSRTITVNVNGDYFIEADETFTVTLSAPTGGATISDAAGIGTIANDDVAGAISIDDVSHSEGDGGTTLYTFTVSRTGQAANVSVQWALGAPGGAGYAGATDFPTGQALSGTITFAGGETSRTITISVLGDHLYEPDESFTVTLSNPSAGATIADGTGIGTIVNDDAAPPFVPGGAETIVNQTLALEQLSSRVAWIDAGHYVVTWTSHVALTDNYEVMARLFNANGTPAGNEFQVNSVSAGDQVGGRIAVLSGGGFVVVWTDGITADVHAQMYNADGSPNGTELALNTDPLHAQSLPWVAALAGGGFVATWMHDDGTSIDVRARTFGADGLPVSAEIPVNTNTNLAQQYAQVTTLSNGHFVVVWQDGSGIGGDGSGTGIKMRVFDGAGAALTAETLVNTTIASTQQFPTVAALAGGGYVVAWEDYSASGGDSSGNALRAQIYDAAGNAVGSEFIVNFTTAGDQSRPTIAALPDGGFVIGWWNQADGVSVNEIRAQTFDALGNRRGGEFEVNSDSAGDQLGAAFAVSANGQLVATWTDFNDSEELTDGEIEQRLFTMPAPGALSIADLSQAEGDAGPSSFTFTVTRAGGSFGAVGATWTLTLSGDADAADFTAVPQIGTVSFADGETSRTITILVQGDALFEPNETFAILLSAPTGGATIADGTGQGTITNDDPMLAPSVDLDGGAGGIDYDGSFTEGSATGIGSAIQVTQGSFPITSATVTLTDGLAGDSLTIAGTLPAGITNISGNDQQIQLVGINMSAAEWAAALGQIVFASSSDNPDNYGTDTARTIVVEVSDGFTISATATATIAIQAVNDAPTVGALDGDSVTWTEGNAYALLDQAMPATIADPDNQNFAGGFVSFGVQVNPRAEDEFFVLDSFPAVGAMGNEVYVGGAHIGTITSSGAGQILTISFTAEATAARVAILLHAIAYRNAAGDVPTEGARSVSYVLNDGQSGASGGVITLDVVAVNDGPTVADTNIAIVEDQIWVLSLADFDIVDPEGDAVATITVTGVTGGLIYYDADGDGAGEPEAITVYPRTFSFGDIAAGLLSWVPEAGVSGDDSSYFQYGVTDEHGAASAGARVYFDIAPVVDAPTVDLNGPDEADTYFEADYAEGGPGAAIADSDVAITSESGVLTGAMITITDAVAGDLLSVAGTLPGLITALYDPDTATLTLSGQGSVAQYQAALAQILYSSTSEDPDAAGTDTQRTIEIVVTDGVVDGAPSSAPAYAYVAVTGEIDNPAIGNLDGDLATFSEGDAFVLLDTGGNATVADLDNANFSGGTLTISFNGTGLSQDRFDVASNDSVSLTPGSVIVDGVTIGSWDGGFPGGDFTVSLNGNATPERVQALLRALAYRNSAGDTPTAGLRDVLITLTDGDGGTVSTASQIEVGAVNDPPTLGANAGLTLAEGATATITPAMLDFNDAEQADSAITYTLASAPTNGILLLNGSFLGVGGSFTQAQVNNGLVSFQHDGGETSSAGFAFSVSDGAGGLVAGQSFAVAVTPVNDAPVVTTTAGTTAYAESVNAAPGTVAVNAGITVADTDDIALMGAQVSITGNYQLGQDILAFTNNNAATFGNISAFYNAGTGVLTLTSPGVTATLAQWQAALRAVTYSNSSEEPNQATRTISFTVHDGDVWSAAATRLLSVTAQNDSPSGADAARTINEDSTFTFTNAHFGFSDVDGDAFAGVRFGAAPVGGTLYFDADGAGGNAPVAITSFPTTTYSAADITAGKLTFVPTPNLNGTGAASVGFTVIDNGGTVGAGQNADLTPNTLTFNITSVNDAPSGADSIITIAEDGAHILTVADFGFSDVDGNAFEAVIFSNVTGGTLTINGNPYTNVTLVYLHTIQSGGIVFTPAANATGPTGSITFTVRDDGGFDNGGQAADTSPNVLTFSMNAVNDAPVNSVPGAQAVDEDGSLVFSTANGNALSVADVDATTLTVTLSVAHGMLTLASNVGLTYLDSGGDATMTFTGTAAAINTALGAGLTYVPAANYQGGDTLSIATSDGGQTGTGGTGTDADTVAISIAAVNDAPSGTSNAFTINEDSTFTFAEAHFGFTDAAEGDDFLGIVIATIPAAGTFLLDGVAVTAGQFVSLHNIALGKLTFAPAADASGAPYGSFTFQVRDDGGTGNGGQDTDQSPNTLTFNVTAVNDAPTNNVPGGQAIDEDASLTLSTGNGNAISVADVDATTLTVTLSVAHGTLTIASTAGLTFSGGSDGTADATMTFSGTAAAINAALGSGLTYNPNANYNGSDAISVATTDGGQTGTGPVGTDSDSIAIGITAINDAPSGTSATIALNEDGMRTLTQADFGFSDPAEGNGFAGVVITTLPTHGILLLNGAALLVAETFVTAAQLADGQLVFQPNANANGAAYAALTFQVRDDGGTANGGQDTDQSANTLTFAVAAINDSPAVDLNGAGVGTSATLNYAENGAAAAIAPGGAIIDVDTTDFGGGSLWVTITNGLNAEDMLSVLNQGSGVGQVGYANGLITYEGVTIADLLPTPGAPVPILDIRFRSNVTVSPAAVQAVLQAIAYHNISQDPATAPRNVTFTFNDGDGNPAGGDPSGSAMATINVASINDAPSGTSATIAINEDSPRILSQADFGFSDPAEGDGFAGVLLTSLPANGTLLLNGVAVAAAGIFVSAAQLAAGQLVFAPGLDGNGAGYASFNFAVRDDGGTAAGGLDTDQSPNTLTFNVAAVNDAPVGANVTITLNEDNGRALTEADFGFSDTADGNAFAGVVLTSLPAAGFLVYDADGGGGLPGVFASAGQFITAAELAMGALTYYPASHANGAGHASFTFQVRDNGGSANGGQDTDQSPNTITFNVNPVNDAPSGADKSITGSEDDPYIFAAADFGFTDPVEGNAFFAVKITTLPAAGDILLNGVAVMAGDFIAVSAINAGMLTFQPDPDAFGAPYASFTFQVQDNGGTANGGADTDQTPNTITIAITPDNLAPVLDLDAGTAGVDATLSYTENDPATRISPVATLTDDSADFAGGTIVAHFAANGAAQDQLSIQSGNGIAVSPTDDTLFYGGVLIGSWGGGVNGADLVVQLNANATAAAVEAVLRAIAYANISDNPSVPARTIEVAVTDGDGGAASALVTVNLVAVDDAAVARGDAFAIDETALLSGNVFLDHGSGADGDVDGPGLAVAAVNGVGASVGQQIQLASGALLRLNADGSFSYDTNHAFDATPTPSSGASNTPALDSFTYTLAGGGTAIVNIVLAGLDTNDVLFGTAGADILAGGAGNDTYFADAADIVIEGADGGFDAIYTNGSYVLAAGVEVEWLSAAAAAGTGAISLTGNEFTNYVLGNNAINVLDGGGGADVLVGYGGNDTYYVDSPGDFVIESAGGGFDAIYTSTSTYALTGGAEVEWLAASVVYGTQALTFTGNELANTILGNSGINVLNGSAGADVLVGYGGNDTYYVDNIGDVIIEAGGGFEAVYTSVSYALTVGAEVEWLSTDATYGTGAINLTGNDAGNYVLGNQGVNIIDGGGGADILVGYGGADTFAFTTALGVGNIDNIVDFVAGSDKIGLDDAIFTAIGGTLSADAFVIGAAAAGTEDRIVYNQATGQLFYDADGSGGAAAILFATLQDAPVLGAGDFTMI
jgi:hypothetical protein